MNTEARSKGPAFEVAIEKLYRLLGADVTRGVMILKKKVDLVATFRIPGGGATHRVLIECKDEGKAVAQNRRVMEMKGLLDVARETNQAESAEIVTRVAWGDAAKGFARSSGIRISTYREKVASLLDLRGYLESLVTGFSKRTGRRDEPPLGLYYVDPLLRVAGSRRWRVLRFDRLLRHWLTAERVPYQLALLGGYGTGKTSFCKRVAYDLARQYLEAKPGSVVRIPILIDLRRFAKSLSVEAMITSFLDEECNVNNPRFKLFEMMNEEGLFVLILDGFDEMAVRVDSDTLEINISEIEKLIASPNARALISSRSEYFASADEQSRLFRPIGKAATGVENRSASYLGIDVALWSDDQIARFLQRRVPLIRGSDDWQDYWDEIVRIPGLGDLARRPVLLSMIVKTLPDLIQRRVEINRANLYETYLRAEVRRQKIEKRRQMLLSDTVRLTLLQQLALEFLTRGSGISFRDARDRIVAHLHIDEQDGEAFTRDFLTCSFLLRESNVYRFSHRSIMEYAAARGLLAELESNEPLWFGSQEIDPYVAGFLAEMRPDRGRLWEWATTSRTLDEQKRARPLPAVVRQYLREEPIWRSNATRVLVLAEVAEVRRSLRTRLEERKASLLAPSRAARRGATGPIIIPPELEDELEDVTHLSLIVGAALREPLEAAEEIVRSATPRELPIEKLRAEEVRGLSLLVYGAMSVGDRSAGHFVQAMAQLDVVVAVGVDADWGAQRSEFVEEGDPGDLSWLGLGRGGVVIPIDRVMG